MRPAAFRRLFLYPFGQLDMLRGKRIKTVSAAGKNAARAARVDVLKAEEAEITVSAVRTAAARAEHVDVRTRAIQRRLRDVQELPAPGQQALDDAGASAEDLLIGDEGD